MQNKSLQLLGWVLLIYFLFSTRGSFMGDQIDWKEIINMFTVFKTRLMKITGFVAFASFSLVAYNVLRYWFPRGARLHIVVILLLCYPALVGFRYLLQEILMPAIWGFSNYASGYSFRHYLLDNLFFATTYYGIGLVFFLNQWSRLKEQEEKVLQLENQQTQLDFLRAQINPHFLFNTLNNIYSLVYQQSNKSLEAVARLSELLRYALYEKTDQVPLEREWEMTKKFIELEQLRYEKPFAINFQVEDFQSYTPIAPLLLLPLVENAIKHGESQDPEKPIRLRLEQADSRILFRVVNFKKQKQQDEQGGIGLQNLNKRLQLLYKTELNIKETPEIFEIGFELKLME
ncbi:MAG: sensor histidine kinase [Bacteroidota bacterium]